jgi:site-specific recombinase XerC
VRASINTDLSSPIASPSTAYHVDEGINHMLTSLGLHENLPLYDITRERLMRSKTMLLRGEAPRGPKPRAQKAPTIAKKLGLIKAWLKWATANGHLGKNPMEGLELPARRCVGC